MNTFKIHTYLLIYGTLLLTSTLCGQESGVTDGKKYLDGEFWRRQGLTQIIPFWQSHVRDTVNGAYYLNLSQNGTPFGPFDKQPAMISRQIFGFTSAFLLSGKKEYLRTANEGVRYLLKYAWDYQFGGWFDLLDQSGKPKETTKTVPNQLYTNVGLALYYFATGDKEVLIHIKESINIQKKYSHDKVNGGYFQTLTRDLSVLDSSKSKHSHYGYSSSLLINLAMITNDKEIRKFAEELMQISLSKMKDADYGWFNGFPVPDKINWIKSPSSLYNKEVISAGAQLTASLTLLRLFEMTGNELYRTEGIRLSKQLLNSAWDQKRGCWFDVVERKPPYKPQDTTCVYWWLQSYGLFLQLHLYNITGEEAYLESYQKMASFWDRYFVDKEYGGVFMNVTPDGMPVTTNKAVAWKASYHEMENSLLNYLYLNLYVSHKPAILHFYIKDAVAGSKHYVSIAENPSVQIIGVSINGKPWKSFNAAERSVILPAGSDLQMEVTLGTKTKV